MAEEPEDQIEAGRRLASFLFSDPETGPQLREMIAKKFPKAKAQMPDVLAREQGSAILTEVRSVLAQDKKERDEDRRNREWQSKVAELKADPELNITDADMPEIIKLMTAPGEEIASPRQAARLYRAQQQLAAPRDSVESLALQVPGRMGAGGDEFKGILEDRDGWSKNRTHQMIADFRSGRGSRWM
jgi:hypothetical protein